VSEPIDHRALGSGEKPPRFAEWIAAPMRRNRGIYLKVAIAATMINLFGLVTSLFSMTVYDRVAPNNATASLIALSIGFGVVVVFDFVLRTLRGYFVDVAGADIDREIGQEVFQRLLDIRLELKKGSTGQLTGLMRELETLRDFFASATISALVDVPFIIVTLVIIAIIGGPVVFVPLAMVPIVILAGYLTHPALERLAARSMGQGMLKQSVLVEAIGGLETVKSAGAGRMLMRRWLQSIDEHADSSLRQRLVSTITVNVAASANSIAYAGVVIVGVLMMAEQKITMGGLVAASMLAGRAVAPLGQIAQLMTRLTQTRTAYAQIDQIMRMPSEGPAGEALRPAIEGRIEFRNVDFRYPGANQKALDDISFTINRGEHVAILGRVGSGKSTIARLILGLYPPESGVILIDGTDVRQFAPVVLRQRIGAAMQDNVLMTGSVRENIVLDRPEVDDNELLRASELSGTHQFMGQIANGYDLRLADRGEGLSGGQRQSISIARALALKPPILVFDEPTSAMDIQTETALIQRLQDEIKGRTLVLITHRLSLVKLVERVIVVDRGKVAMDGPAAQVLQHVTRPKAAA